MDCEKCTGGNQTDEYVLLDLGDTLLPPGEIQYTLSGLDTMNPILTLADGRKLIGEYEETVGTCFVFSEHAKPSEQEPRTEHNDEEEHAEALDLSIFHPRGAKLTPEKNDAETSKQVAKEIKSFCQLERKLKFRLLDDDKDN